MKAKLKAAATLIALSCASFAAPPESLAGFIFYETGRYAGPRQPPFEQFAAVFAADGTYSEIYFRKNPGSGFDQQTKLGQPRSGTYSYRRFDSVSAELNFDGRPGVLRYDTGSEHSGQLVDLTRTPFDISGIVERRFRLVPLSALSPLVNCSNRSFVRPGGTAFTGFVISAAEGRVVLIRAVGPGLAAFGLAGWLRDPVLQIRRAVGGVPWTNDNWNSENATSIQRSAAAVGAFSLPVDSADAATIIPLRPDSYIVEVSSADPMDSGEVLIEVYVLP